MITKRFFGEVVALSCDCELGQEGDRAVVAALVDPYISLTMHVQLMPTRSPSP